MKNSNLAMLNYTFMFKPSDTSWDNALRFQDDLGRFFDAKGFNAQVIDSVAGNVSTVMVIITKKEELEPPEPPQTSVKVTPPKQQVNNMKVGK